MASPGTTIGRLQSAQGSIIKKNHAAPLSSNDTISTADTNSIFGQGDKRQKRVVYTSFAENPFDVLAIQVEESPSKPRDKDDVVIKVSVSEP